MERSCTRPVAKPSPKTARDAADDGLLRAATGSTSRRGRASATSARDHHDLDELGHVEQAEAHARVLDVVAGDDLATRPRACRRAARLFSAMIAVRNMTKPSGCRKIPQVGSADPVEPADARRTKPKCSRKPKQRGRSCPARRAMSVSRSVLEDHEEADDREPHRDLVRDHLGRGAQARRAATSCCCWPSRRSPCRRWRSSRSRRCRAGPSRGRRPRAMSVVSPNV